MTTKAVRDCYRGVIVELDDGTVAEWIGPVPGWSPPAGWIETRLKVLKAGTPPEGRRPLDVGEVARYGFPLAARLKVTSRPR